TLKISNDGTKLELQATVDYETNTNKTLSFSVKVNDGNGHEFTQDFTLEIKDVDDVAPTNILINTTNIADNIPASMQVAYFSAVDSDTVGTHRYSFDNLNGVNNADNGKFTLSTDGKLSVKAAVNFATQSQYHIVIQVADTGATFSRGFTLNVVQTLTITSPATATAVENTNKVITLTANRDNVAFAITNGADKAKFTLSGTTLTFAATDFEARTNDNTYEVEITASKTGEISSTQTLIVTLTDLNDETPTAITFSGNLSIAESTVIGAELGTFATTDADTSDTFTYTSSNTAFTFDNNKLKLNTTLNYETTTSLATTITVTDGNSHTFNKDFTFTITDTNNIAPSNIQLTTTTIADNTTAGTTIATISATDTDTTGETITYTLGGTDATSFTISGNQLKTAYTVVFANKSSYNISIIASDGVNASAPMNFTLAVYENLAITSLATATAIENTAKAITLIANKSGTTFAITDGTDKAKFTLSGTTLTFAATDFEARTNDNTYEVVITARKTGETDATQTLIITLTDINDESPTAITFTGNLSIAENTIIGAELGTFSTTDADTSDTFTYTSSNTAFTFDNNKLKLNAALDYESPISLVTTITVTDANSHTFNKDFTFIIADTNDITPSSIQLSATTIADSTLANTTVATLAATDEDTTGETITYTLGGADATSFTISGNQLKIVNTVVHTTKSSYNITITASDGTNTSAPMNFSFSVNANFAITSSAAATVIENTSKTITLTANRNDATFTITGGADKAKFTLSSTTLTFAATDFEARANSAYEVVITASKRGETDATQTLIVTLTDINDETPTAITFTGNLSIAENTTTTELGTFSTTDADTGDTFTYTSSNTAFILDNNKLKLNTTLDYENTTNLTTTITVTDGNSHTFNKDFTFTITDANDIAPSSIQLTTTTIADTTTAGTTIATISATDADTTGETITYTLGGADATSFTINGNQLKIANTVVHATKSSYNITITASDGTNTSAPMNFSFSVNADFAITSSTTVTAIEKADKVITLTANKSGATFAITGGINRAKFTLNDATLTFTATDFEDGAENTYKVEITAYKTGETDVTQTLTLTLEKIVEIAIANQSRSVNENSAIDTNIGTPLIITGTIATFEITAGNDDDLFKINNTGQIQVAKNALDHENKSSHILTVKITGTNAIDKTAQITIVITDIDDTAPTNIVLSKSTITSNDAPVGTIIGTLFATDIDTTSNLTYSVSANDNFKISGNKLKLKKAVADITFPITITITASDGTRTSAQQNFEITKATINLNIVPAINQFIVIQGEKEGRIISKDGGEVKIHTLVDTQTYEWSGTDINGTDINDGASNSTTLTFDPSKITLGTVTVKLKVTTGEHTSERTLLLKLIEKSEDVNSDSDGDGIPDEKDINHAGNQIQADEDEGENKGKAIISKENTRILLGDLALGKNSTLLTLDQIKEYVTTNNLLDKTKDTLTTGAIYDYVVEGLSATGISSEVIIELTTAIPKDAELRKYSLVNGWSNFVVNNNNKIYSKTGATCTDDDQKTWKVGLIEGATCLKLTIKDGGENDTDGQQTDNTGDVNSVIVSTIAIATPVANSGDDSDDGDGGSSSSSSGGGCVYNPNAPARFDMGFILLMVLGAYYLLRRKRRLIR
ncbi:beta strand repeat-containing protein, partial [Bathymodiolus thermophilus thioautotrophic gill symbiont]